MRVIKIMKKNRLLALVGLFYGLLYIFMPEHASKALRNSVYYLIEMFEVLPVIFLLTVIIEAWIPKEVIMKGFGEKSGLMGNILSLILGSISAGPIYAAFPISKMLLSKGASIANVVIILSSWAVIKVPMLANEAKFLGGQFMAVRWILTVIAIFIMAYVTSRIVKKETVHIDIQDQQKEVLEINQDYCMGCGICVRMLPNVYELNEKKAYVKGIILDQEIMADVMKSIDKCPMKAIKYL